MFTCSADEIICWIYNKLPRSKVYIRLILNTVLLPGWSTAVFFCDSCSWVKHPLGYPAYFEYLNPFPQWIRLYESHNMTVWIWNPSFLTEDNWGTRMQLLYANTHWCSKRKNNALSLEVKTFERNVLNYIFFTFFLNIIFFSCSTTLQKLQRYLHVSQKSK